MTRDNLAIFVSQFEDFFSWPRTRQIDCLTYYLTANKGVEGATVVDIEKCMVLLDMRPYARIAKYLSEGTKKKNGRYVRHSKGYRLQRVAFDEIKAVYGIDSKRVQVAKDLSSLMPRISDLQEQSFLEEAIRCYQVESYRAATLMVWILTMDHLQKYVFKKNLLGFNNAIASHADKKMQRIVSVDDFSNLKEGRVVELMRTANIISKDVKKILDEKLGIRNSVGHPSGIRLSGHKATEFILDLTENVLLKY